VTFQYPYDKMFLTQLIYHERYL